MSSCAKEAPSSGRFIGVPLPIWTYGDQVKSAQAIEARCGSPPHCPPEAYLERATLDYVKLREEVKAVAKP